MNGRHPNFGASEPIAPGGRDRCQIYQRIDELDGTRTVSELTKQLKPILNELAYYAVTGEGAVMESQEEWHTEFTGHLQDEAKRNGTAPPVNTRGRLPRQGMQRSRPFF
jgi:hypothetical protein